jgi:transposase
MPATAAKFEVSVSFVVKLMQRWRQRGTVCRTGTAAGNGRPLQTTPIGCSPWRPRRRT